MKKLSLFLGVFAALAIGLSSCADDISMKPTLDSDWDQEMTHMDNGKIIPGQYIVVFKKGAIDEGVLRIANTLDAKQGIVADKAKSIMAAKGIPASKLQRSYGKAIQGFVAELTDDELDALSKDLDIDFIEPDRVVMLAPPPGAGPPGSGGGDDGGGSGGESTPWGIADIGAQNYTGNNKAWILDTGIDLDHPDLNVDVANGFTAFTKGKDASDADDGNGHGSHCAGTVAAIGGNGIGVIGVAAGATVVPVKVLDSRGSGSYSGVIAGVEYVAANASNGDVANMSLGGPTSDALDLAVQTAAGGGVRFALAAGNDGDDANNHSPARVNGNNIWTVSARAENGIPTWSNYGVPPVDACAPGVSVESTWKNGGYNTISGTSMAAPHVCGMLLFTTNVTNGSDIIAGGNNYGPSAGY